MFMVIKHLTHYTKCIQYAYIVTLVSFATYLKHCEYTGKAITSILKYRIYLYLKVLRRTKNIELL